VLRVTAIHLRIISPLLRGLEQNTSMAASLLGYHSAVAAVATAAAAVMPMYGFRRQTVHAYRHRSLLNRRCCDSVSASIDLSQLSALSAPALDVT